MASVAGTSLIVWVHQNSDSEAACLLDVSSSVTSGERALHTVLRGLLRAASSIWLESQLLPQRRVAHGFGRCLCVLGSLLHGILSY